MDDRTHWTERWEIAWEALGVVAERVPAGALADLLTRYAEPHRHYHTVRHLEECFARFDRVRAHAERTGEVAIALFHHDAVYDPKASDNEARSAELASGTMRAAGVEAPVIARVRDLILATRHAEPPGTPDAALLIDVDLGILAADPARFDEYERDVRAEYGWVPGLIFRRKRRAILEGFLARPRIFTSGLFDADEAPARANLRRSIARL